MSNVVTSLGQGTAGGVLVKKSSKVRVRVLLFFLFVFYFGNHVPTDNPRYVWDLLLLGTQQGSWGSTQPQGLGNGTRWPLLPRG